MPFQAIQNGFVAGEVSPSLYGRTDLDKYHQGAFTMRNFFSNYRGGAASRAGFAYVGTCKQPGTGAPPRDIPFQFSITQGYALEFGDQYMRIKSQGAYVTEAAQQITFAAQSNPCELTIPGHGYSAGDWLYIAGIVGMPELDALTWIVDTVPDANHVTLLDLFGQTLDATGFPAYVSGGVVSRIYTVVAPYAAVDLPYLKFTQSADTMTLCCVNQETDTEYPSYELERFGATDWTFTEDSFFASISPPVNVAAAPQSSTTEDTYYSYVVTAVDANSGEESIASAAGGCENNDIAIYAGSNVITWNQVNGAGSYNVYKATPSYQVGVPIGSQYGYLGTAFATSFTDSNITADFTQVPPTHQNPFARGQIVAVNPTSAGSGYDQSTVGFTITTASGTGFEGVPVIIGGLLVAFLVEIGGVNYATGDTISFTGGATAATATLVVGPESGTYPGTVAYFQQRRVYAASLNNPDTYYMSQPGAFDNFDSSIPTSDADAIIGTPWAQQVNGVQALVPMPGGLVILTGKGAWQLTGGNSAAITPSDQDATPQAYNGCNNIVPPIVVNYDILYLQAKGSIFRDLSYNFFVNIYTGTDLTVLSNHLFTGHTFSQWCWAEEPYKLAWAVRDDGVMLSLTYLKEQDVYAWSRHDTNGQFVGVCSITEPPVDAVYAIVKRYVRGGWRYYSERMDNRDWSNPESCWCVDAGLAYPSTSPDAELVAAAATGGANITSVLLAVGGSGYVAPVVQAVDPSNAGSGASFSVTLVDGAITGIAVVTTGVGYAYGTRIVITDVAGSGAVAQAVITNIVEFSASVAGTFSLSAVGDVIRMGGGIASITSILTNAVVLANLTTPITATIPNDPNNMPAPALAGTWNISRPTSSVSGLNHLEGLTVSILADGSVVPQQIVTDGAVTLPYPASLVLVGMPFTAQLQSSYLDPPGQPVTAQSKRKNIYSVAVRAEATRGISVGSNQPDASAQPNGATVPWSGLMEVKERNSLVSAGASVPLYTGDYFINIPAGWDTRGQIAVEQTYPLPANILAVISYFQIGDTSA